jgi:hypothetical protein
MSQPVKLSDQLVVSARQVGNSMSRSISGQIEHWAELGKIIEPYLEGRKTAALRQSREGQSLTEIFATIDHPEGKHRVQEYLKGQPFPHFEASGKAGVFTRIDADGTRVLGRFVRKQFRPIAVARRKAA